jgi:hypothetical protein
MHNVMPVRPTRQSLSAPEWFPRSAGGGTLGLNGMLSVSNVHLLIPWQPTQYWPQRIMTRLVELLSLPAGWDTYDAPPIDQRAVARAGQLLLRTMDEWSPLPDILPSSDGGVILEWYRPTVQLRIDVPPEGSPELYYQQGDASWEGTVGEATPDVRELLFRVSLAA